MKLAQKLSFQPPEKRKEDESLPPLRKRDWEEIARVVNFNAVRLMIVVTAAELATLAASPTLLREDQIAYNKTDGLLYRWSGAAWVQP